MAPTALSEEMTPMKPPAPSAMDHYYGDGENDGDKLESLSPPRTSTKLHLNTRLFDDDFDEDAEAVRRQKNVRLGQSRFNTGRDDSFISDISGDSSPVLRTVDMNISASPSSHSRKRPSDRRPAGREETGMFQGEDDGMFVSPRSSHSGSSPSYRTLDGRTVTSKNPFSPYTPMTEEETSTSEHVPMQTAPTFPVSFYSRATTSSFDYSDVSDSSKSTAQSKKPAVPPRQSKIQLQRREQKANTPWRRGPTHGNGYPDRHGRYSFTGSPIEEIDVPEKDLTSGMGCKIRRLRLDDRPSGKPGAEGPVQLFVDTDAKCNKTDEISPTDVFSFPSSPSPTKRASRYTPVRSMQPPTPMMERRVLSRAPSSFHDEDSRSNPSQPKSRFKEDFDVIGELGNGSFGTVYKCLSRLDGCMYAVKAAKRKAKGKSDRDRMLKEVYALAALSDQADTAAFHIVRYHQAWMEENRLYIQTELCTSTLIAEMNDGSMDEGRRYKLLREILLALELIHKNGMVHLDIKPENIFIKTDQFKLGDFGLVSTISNHDVEEGDSRYMSLELLSGDTDDLTKSDVFSLGATLYEICLGRTLPMDGQEWQNIRAGVFSRFQSTSYEMEALVKQMMHPDPSERPSASALLKRRQLMSTEQKQLMDEKSKVLEANRALALQTQMMQKIPAPGRGRLMRANTWNGTF